MTQVTIPKNAKHHVVLFHFAHNSPLVVRLCPKEKDYSKKVEGLLMCRQESEFSLSGASGKSEVHMSSQGAPWREGNPFDN